VRQRLAQVADVRVGELVVDERSFAALLRAMTFMIVASPCAIMLLTMSPLLSAISTAGRYGVLVRSAVVLEQLGGASAIALDETARSATGFPPRC